MSISQEGTRFRLQNPFLRREIETGNGPTTTLYHIRPTGRRGAYDWLPLFAFERHAPFEAAVCVDGRWAQAGPVQPGTRTWERTSAFDVAQAEIGKTAVGMRLTLRCLPRPGQDVPPLEMSIHYEIADELPLLSQQVRVKNISTETLTVDNVTVGTVRNLRHGTELRVFTDYYWNSEAEDPYYKGWIRTEFPDPIRLHLEPGESFDTFRMMQTCTPNEPNAAAVAVHRVIKALAPWITETYVTQLVGNVETYAELEEVAVRAQADGMEAVHFFVDQIFPASGDYVPHPHLFANGDDDVKRLVAHYHKHDLKVLPYCSLTIATHDSTVWKEHQDWEYHGPDGIRYDPGGHGNMCYQSGWGEYIARQMDYIIDTLGFDGLAIDGPYHGLPCLAEHHRHPTPESVRFMNWQWEREFFGRMRDRGVYVAAPVDWQALLLGVNARPGGYTEEDVAVMGGLAVVTANRSRLYDWRHKVPACCSWDFLAIDEYHDHSIGVSEDDPTSYDHALGGTFGYGHFGMIHGTRLHVGPKTKAVFRKWLEFFKTHRATLAGEQVHLARPDGHHVDGMLHVNPAAEPPAVAVLFNPSPVAKSAHLLLPLSYAGFAEGGNARIDTVGAVELDGAAQAHICVTLEAFETRTLAIRHA